MTTGTFGRYDSWKLADGDDPGRGNGEAPKHLLRCASCAWTGAFSDAVGHYRETGHVVTYKGLPQDFTKFADAKGEQR